MAANSEVFYSKNTSAVTASASWTDLRSITFTPVALTKFVALGYGQQNRTDLPDPFRCDADEIADWALTVDGTTVCELKGQNYGSLIWFGELAISSHTIVLRAKVAGISLREWDNLRLGIFGVEDWEIVEQGAGQTSEILGTQTRLNKILMQHVFHPRTTDSLVLVYGEIAPHVGTGDEHVGLKVYFDNDNDGDSALMDSTYRTGVVDGWLGSSAAERVQLSKGEHHLVFASQNFKGAGDQAKFRRLRAAMIPLHGNPFVVSEVSQFKDRYKYTGADLAAGVTTNTLRVNEQVFAGLTYMALGSFRQGVNSVNYQGHVLMRYVGLGLTGSSTDFTTVSRDDLINIGTSRQVATLNDVLPIHGAQAVGFHIANAVADSNSDVFLENVTFDEEFASPPNTVGSFSAVEHRNLMLLQFQQNVATIPDSASPVPKERYSSYTLVEINKPLSIERYSLSDDIYLLDGVTSSEIVTKIQSGDIDDESVVNILVTGQQVLDAINAGDTTTAASLVDLASGLPEGVTTSPVSEFFTYSSINRLYKRGVAKSIRLSDNASNAYFGVVGTEKATIEFANNNNEFTTVFNIPDMFGCDIKVMNYDSVNKTVVMRFNGKITDVSVGDVVQVTAINPNMDVLDSELPKVGIIDVSRDESFANAELLSPDNPDSSIPLFFGKARRALSPSVGKSFGDETTDPDFLNSFADYAIGGPLLGSQYRSVIFDDEYVEKGVYRGWLGVTNTQEFSAGQDVVSFDKYTVSGKAIPVVSFSSFLLTTSTRVGPLGMPHRVNFGSEDVGLTTFKLYPQFTPVTKFLAVLKFDEGTDWVGGILTPDTISWLTAGDQPKISLEGTTTGVYARGVGTSGTKLFGGGFTDLITGITLNAQWSQVLTLDAVTQTLKTIAEVDVGVITFTKDVHYTVSSSNVNRDLEDKINWALVKSKRGEWGFNGNLLDGLTLNPLVGSAGQPVYTSQLSALESIGTVSLGTVGITTGAISPAGQLDFSVAQDFRLTVFVSNNTVNELIGTVVKKAPAGSASGFILDIAAEDTIFGPSGDPDKRVARAKISNGTALINMFAGTTTAGINLTDGNVHKIDLLVTRDLATGSKDFVRFLVDDKLMDSHTATTDMNLTNTADFIVGGAVTGTGDFKGIIHNIVIAEDGEGDPEEGKDYNLSWSYLKDGYHAIWEYDKIKASNPVPVGSDILPIGFDMKVAGCDLVPTNIVSTVPLTGSTTMSWVEGPADSGYAVRFNFTDPENAWNLGTAGLSETTFLGGVSAGDGRVEFTNNTAIMRQPSDFTVYFSGVWRGGIGEDSIAIAKETVTNGKPSYALGIAGGKAYGAVTVDTVLVPIGTAASGAESKTPVDSKVPMYIQMERAGNTLNLYLNGQLEATRSVGISRGLDFDSSPLVVASKAIYDQRWVGDISFFGLLDFAAGEEFAKLQMDMMVRGIKGGWTQSLQGVNRDVKRSTVIHVPFTEGTGTTIKSRNLHRNYGQTLKRVLSDSVVGAGERVDGLNFDKSITLLDDLGLKCDFIQTSPRKMSDILNDLGVVRGITLKKTSTGKWKILVDDAAAVVTAKFGQGDGHFENIIKVNNLKYRSSDEAVKDVRVEYRQFHDTEGNLSYHAFVDRDVLPYGTSEKVFQNPYILDHKTADKVADYLGKKLRVNSKELSIVVGQEGMKLKFGNIVEVSIPRMGITAEVFQVVETSSDGITVDLTLHGYSPQIFDYDPGPLPLEENIITSDGR